MAHQILAADLASGTALTNSTAETVLASKALLAYALQTGKVYHLHAAVRATATNSTDTLQVRFRVGPTTLAGTVVADAAAVDVANNDVVVIDMYGVVRDADSSSNIVWSGLATTEGAEGTVTARARFEVVSSLDYAVAQRFEITGQWSVASASNSAQSELFLLEELA